jgi:hypothetical protein
VNTLDDTLRNALHDAADRYEIPPGGTEQILEAARSGSRKARRGDGNGGGGGARHWNHRRITMVAAVAIVLVALAGSLSWASLGTSHNHNLSPLGSHAMSGLAAPNGKSAQFGANLSVEGNRQSSPGRQAPTVGPAASPVQTKVVSVGAVSITVPSSKFNRVLARITSVATGVGGYVSSSKVTGGAFGPGTSGMVELRVPQKHFSVVVARVEGMGHVVSVVTNSTDVTGQYVDYQSRIGALQTSRAQYLAIMARASSIGDILAIQAQVNVIESQIEQLEGQRNLLVNQAAYGTLTVSINQGLASSHTSGVRKAWSESISGFVGGIEWLIRAAGPALFGLLCLAALLLLGRFGWRASRRRLI